MNPTSPAHRHLAWLVNVRPMNYLCGCSVYKLSLTSTKVTKLPETEYELQALSFFVLELFNSL